VEVASTSSRTLRLLSLLQRQRSWRGEELAERLEVSARTLRRDVERLRDLGYPVEAQRGVAGGYQLAAGAVLPPLLLDDDEAIALTVGLSTALQGDAVAGIGEASARALAKITKVMPARLRREVDALAATIVPATWYRPEPVIEPSVLALLAQACHDGERLSFSYSGRDGPTRTRSVEPHRLVALGQRWYLVAWDLDRDDWRSFRVDRLDDPQRSGSRLRPRPLPFKDAADFVRAGIDSMSSHYAVEAIVHGPPDEVRQRVGRWAEVKDLDDEHCRLTMSTDTLEWAVLTLGGAGYGFEVVNPPELTDLLRDWAMRFRRASLG
jgi:predicted DNA-binding transcriptional regulator YafY